MQANPVDLDLDPARIAEAATAIDPVFLNTPQFVDEQLCAALGRTVLVKVETLNPIRSFKARGAEWLLAGLAADADLVCASSGNFGQAIAYAAGRRGMTAEVFVPVHVNQGKLARMRSLGSVVHQVEGDIREAARDYARQRPGRIFVEDGREPAVAEGAGTIGMELLAAGGIDTVVAPVGDGALITGVARWIKEYSPGTTVVGVCSAGAPGMARSWRSGQSVAVEVDTIADGINIRVPIPESLARMRVLVDEVVLVDDEAMLAAIRTAAETLGLLLEPAGAAALAAIAEHDLPGGTVAAVLSGANLDRALLERVLGRR
ncbi:threonine ammonia-lyase [Amycolatopsis cihanbeyliensis]|uniref:Threonine dehydratase n=1 Tax=Amycolatopsis cihanbeyliensis TaxID=1128664 RepID=A0A542DEM6_AMYCI|nr:pyridoxal-phosphate dependent enzyme [Amycolatopsis cihanbeyliensis]TQJ01527.1 threonine dehydratase [Amycolatopsis cihanbeyliensis]